MKWNNIKERVIYRRKDRQKDTDSDRDRERDAENEWKEKE